MRKLNIRTSFNLIFEFIVAMEEILKASEQIDRQRGDAR